MKSDSYTSTARKPWTSSAKSHAGSVRPLNEDAYLNEPYAGLWCVADGMGGHLKGEIASSLIVEKLYKLLAEPDISSANIDSADKVSVDAIRGSIDEANVELANLAKQLGEKVGTTAAVLFIEENTAHVLWVGDSRIYHLSDNQLVQLTEDHNQAAELLKYGFITEAQARRHPGSSLLTRAVGTSSSVQMEYKSIPWKANDKFVLCSDGLNAVMEDDSVIKQLLQPDPVDLSQWLINTALERWALDNITAVVVEC